MTVKKCQSQRHVKAEVILNAWKNYCRTSWIYRFLERLGLK